MTIFGAYEILHQSMNGWTSFLFSRQYWSRDRILGYLSLLTFWIIVPLIWLEIPQGLFAGTDGRLLQLLIENSQSGGIPWQTNNINTMQGAFNLALPFNTALSSTFPLLYIEGWNGVFISSVINFLLFSISIFFLSRCLGLNNIFSFLAVFASCLQTIYPFQYIFSTSVQFLIWPTAFLSIAQFNFMLGIAFIKNNKNLILRYLSFLLILIWSISSEPLWVLINGMFFFPFFVIALLSKGRAIIIHSAYLFGIIVIISASGLLEYIYTLGIGNSRSMVMEAWRGAGFPVYTSGVFVGKWTFLIHISVFVSLLFGALFTKGRRQFISFSMFSCLVVFYLVATYYLAYAQVWPFPFPLYYETHSYSVFIVVAVGVIAAILRDGIDATPIHLSSWGRRAASVTFSLVAPVVIVACAMSLAPNRSIIYQEPIESYRPIAERALDMLRQDGGEETLFTVSVLNIGRDQTPSFNHVTGHLLNMGARTMNEYAQVVTPPAHFLTTRLTDSEEATKDQSHPYNHYKARFNKLTIASYQENLFRSFAVKVVVSGEPLHHAALEAGQRVDIANGGHAYVHRVRNPEVILRPSRIEQTTSIAKTIALLQQPDVDVRETLLLKTRPLDDFVRADDASLRVGKNKLHVTIKSDGPTIIVLPVYYSHCWKIEDTDGVGARIFRGNGAFTALSVNRSAELTLHFTYGIFNAGCRRRDMEDWRDDIDAMAEGPGLWDVQDLIVFEKTPRERLFEAIIQAKW